MLIFFPCLVLVFVKCPSFLVKPIRSLFVFASTMISTTRRPTIRSLVTLFITVAKRKVQDLIGYFRGRHLTICNPLNRAHEQDVISSPHEFEARELSITGEIDNPLNHAYEQDVTPRPHECEARELPITGGIDKPLNRACAQGVTSRPHECEAAEHPIPVISESRNILTALI